MLNSRNGSSPWSHKRIRNGRPCKSGKRNQRRLEAEACGSVHLVRQELWPYHRLLGLKSPDILPDRNPQVISNIQGQSGQNMEANSVSATFAGWRRPARLQRLGVRQRSCRRRPHTKMLTSRGVFRFRFQGGRFAAALQSGGIYYEPAAASGPAAIRFRSLTTMVSAMRSCTQQRLGWMKNCKKPVPSSSTEAP